MIIARQSTARIVTVGPVLDASGVAVTDGVVADFKLSKNGGIPAAFGGLTTLTHRHTGNYSLALVAGDLDTVGSAEVILDDTVNACPIKVITVIEEATYDEIFAASALGYIVNAPVNVAQLGGDAQSATDLKDFADAGYDPATNKVQGVVLVDTLTTYTGNTVQTGDAFARLGAPAGASVSADVAAVKVDTAAILIDTGTTLDGRIPAALVSGRMDASVGAMATDVITAASMNADASAEIADAVWDEDATGHQTQGTFGQAIGDPAADTNTIFKAVVTDATGATVGVDAAAILDDTGTAGVVVAAGSKTGYAIGAGGIDASSFAANAITDASVADDVVTAIWAKAIAELSQATPSATPSVLNALTLLHMIARNQVTVTSTSKQFTNDAGTVVFKKALTDDGTTYTEAEMVSGP